MVDQGVYPDRGKPGGYDRYSQVLAQFIKDVRKDLNAPKLPFVIGVLGVGGPVENYGPSQQRYKGIHSNFRHAMAAPASRPEFKGNVAAVLTEKYWDAELDELKSRNGKINAKARELNQDKTLTRQQREETLEKYRAELLTPRELEVLKRQLQRRFPLQRLGQNHGPNRQRLCRCDRQNAIALMGETIEERPAQTTGTASHSCSVKRCSCSKCGQNWTSELSSHNRLVEFHHPIFRLSIKTWFSMIAQIANSADDAWRRMAAHGGIKLTD